MSKRFSLAIAAALLIAGTLSAAGLGTTIATPAVQADAHAITAVTLAPAVAPLVLPVRFDPRPVANACTAACLVEYNDCLDGCDKAPFPGCYNFCRFDVLYPCYGNCFGQ